MQVPSVVSPFAVKSSLFILLSLFLLLVYVCEPRSSDYFTSDQLTKSIKIAPQISLCAYLLFNGQFREIQVTSPLRQRNCLKWVQKYHLPLLVVVSIPMPFTLFTYLFPIWFLFKPLRNCFFLKDSIYCIRIFNAVNRLYILIHQRTQNKIRTAHVSTPPSPLLLPCHIALF